MQENIILDTRGYEDDCSDVVFDLLEDDVNYIESELGAFRRRYEDRYKTSIAGYLFKGTRSSHYGFIGGGGSSVGKWIDPDRLIEMFVSDDTEIVITEEKELLVRTFDHDGVNNMYLKFITQKEIDRYEESWYDDIRIWDDEVLNKNSVKLDKVFIDSFGPVMI